MAKPTTDTVAATHDAHRSGGRAAYVSLAGRRWSWVWLLVGTMLLPFANLQTLIPLAAWLAPVFLLRFTRCQRPLVGLPVLAVAMFFALLIASRNDFFPVGAGPAYHMFVASLAVGGLLPFAVDRWLSMRLAGFSRTLVFPAAVTTAELLGTIGNPYGTAGSTAYSQYGSLPLMQLVSVTGIWALTFLISWLAPVVNQAWERGWSGSGVKAPVVLLAATMTSALLFGGARLAFAAPAVETVRVAALAPDRELSELAYSAPEIRSANQAERATVSEEYFAPVVDDLFERSEREALAGAKVIAWSEAAARTLLEEQAEVVARAAALAREHRVYVQVSMMVQLPEGEGAIGAVNENHAVLLDPEGTIVWDYQKAKPTPGDGQVPAPAVMPTVDTPYGRLATIICQDDFFPEFVRQAGAKGVDILLVPSSDWEAVADWHAQQAPFRAIENGVALVRPTRQGISLATDGHGRLLGHKADYFVSEEQTLVTSVPTQGNATVYAVVGDVFGYASAFGLVVLVGAALRPKRRRQERGGAGARLGSDQTQGSTDLDRLLAR
jgi:apolipoprotein N-acyltransferase